eukprot:9494016-Pyramimonas_sp.AAC.1
MGFTRRSTICRTNPVDYDRHRGRWSLLMGCISQLTILLSSSCHADRLQGGRHPHNDGLLGIPARILPGARAGPIVIGMGLVGSGGNRRCLGDSGHLPYVHIVLRTGLGPPVQHQPQFPIQALPL